jgi:hypothetical protein
MAFQRVDPRPFAPPGFHHQEVHHRAAMVRAAMHPPWVHEDYAIVSINPLPNHPLQSLPYERWSKNSWCSICMWTNDYIQSALSSFGRLIMWENDRDHLTWLMVCARVSELQDVPYFIVVTEAEGFQAESWNVQVEIVEQEMLGALPADEEPIP